MRPIRVLCVDDSALTRGFLRLTLSGDPSIEVVGTAGNPFEARQLIKDLEPNVLTLDVMMPLMNGYDFLERLMRLRPMPVVMFSSLTRHGSDAAVRALSLGAVDVVAKPTPGTPDDWRATANELIARVKSAVRAKPQFREVGAIVAPQRPPPSRAIWPSGRVVAIGASTGGVQALRTTLPELPLDCPPIVIAQHMPASFTRSFANRLDATCRIDVCEAVDGLELRPGLAVIAPGNQHLEIERSGGVFVCRLRARAKSPGVAPSADVLLQSVALAAGSAGVGIVLTGMGRDGALGLAAMKRAGAMTATQSAASCLIYGMPKAANDIGAARYEIDLKHLATFIVEAPSKGRVFSAESEGGLLAAR